MAERAPPIGFLGTGIMGVQMARRLAQAGHSVRAWNRSREKAERLAAFGAEAAASPADAVRDAEIVVCMLSSGPVCDEVLLGPGGTLAAMRKGSTLIVMSSIPVETAQAQARAAAAQSVALSRRARSRAARGRCRGHARHHGGRRGGRLRAGPPGASRSWVGRPGSGLPALASSRSWSTSSSSPARSRSWPRPCSWRSAAALHPAKVREALLGGFAHSTILEQHALRMIARDFKPGGPAKYQVKDTSTALAPGRHRRGRRRAAAGRADHAVRRLPGRGRAAGP